MDSSPGTWRADLWAPEGIPVVLGHARSRQAIHGGKAQHDQIDAQNIAALRRGGLLPQASGSPAAMRATRDLLRRRRPLARKRAARLAPVQHTKSQEHLPAIGTKMADTATRAGVAERCADPAVHKHLAGDLPRISDADARLREVARPIRQPATHQDATTLYLRPTVPGIGKILRRVWRDESHAITRVPTVPDGVAYGRLVTWAKESAGKRVGTAGTTIGHAPLPWAFSAAAVLCLRAHPPAPHVPRPLGEHT